VKPEGLGLIVCLVVVHYSCVATPKGIQNYQHTLTHDFWLILSQLFNLQASKISSIFHKVGLKEFSL
jgi:uncharacterized membrane protein YcfT